MQSVNDRQLRVGGGEESKSQRHRTTDHGLPVVQLEGGGSKEDFRDRNRGVLTSWL